MCDFINMLVRQTNDLPDTSAGPLPPEPAKITQDIDCAPSFDA
jgi:hypothetical protein